MSGWEEVRRSKKLTTDVYRSPLFVKRPKVSYQLCVEINPFVTERGRANMTAAAEKPIIPALELTERTLKAYSVLIGCNPVLTEVCYCITILKGKEQYLISRLQREYRYIECIYLRGKRKSKILEHITFPCDRLWQALLTSTLFTVFQKLMLPLTPNFTH